MRQDEHAPELGHAENNSISSEASSPFCSKAPANSQYPLMQHTQSAALMVTTTTTAFICKLEFCVTPAEGSCSIQRPACTKIPHGQYIVIVKLSLQIISLAHSFFSLSSQRVCRTTLRQLAESSDLKRMRHADTERLARPRTTSHARVCPLGGWARSPRHWETIAQVPLQVDVKYQASAHESGLGVTVL